jgi:hypothetical protein
MWLVYIEPDCKSDIELHSFKCLQCNYQETQAVDCKTAPAPLPPEYRLH